MYVEEVMEEIASTTGAVDAGSIGADGINVTEEVPLCFIKYLLRERYVRDMCDRAVTETAPNLVMIPEKPLCCSSTSTMQNSSQAKKIVSISKRLVSYLFL